MFLKFLRNDRLRERRFLISLLLGIFIGSFLFLLLNYYPVKKDIVFGVTFSKKYAEELGLDWQKVYLDILDDLKVKMLRLPVYWDDVEKEIGRYDFGPYDWMINEAEKRNVKVILNLGIKLPRWPECHVPDWVENKNRIAQLVERVTSNATPYETLEESAQPTPYRTEGSGLGFAGDSHQRNLDIERLFLPFLRDAVERYKDSSAVWAIQIENEPYFFRSFGICPTFSKEFLDNEIELVKQIGGRSVVLTESGELGNWERMINKADILGVSLYRITWNRWVGYFFYPLTPLFYREKINVLKPYFEDIIITELQVEPWTQKPITQTPLKEQFKTMDLGQFKNNIDFVKRVGVDEVYLWGVEWWDYMRKMGDNRFWEEGRKLFVLY